MARDVIVNSNTENPAQEITTRLLDVVYPGGSGAGSLSTTGGTTTKQPEDAPNKLTNVTGTLTSNAVLILTRDAGSPLVFEVRNATSGAYTLTIKVTSGGTGVPVTAGTVARLVTIDGTNLIDITPSVGGGAISPTLAGDGVTDDFAALQTALDAAGASTGRREVLLNKTSGGYKLTQPLLLNIEGQQVTGLYDALYRLPRIYGDFKGPLVVCGKPGANLVYEAAPTGGGRCVNIPITDRWFNFNDLGLNLNGLATFSVRVQCRATAYSNAVDEYCQLTGSVGVRSENLASADATMIGKAYQILVDGAGKMIFYLTVGGVLKTLTAGAGTFPLNTNNEVLLSYDGTTVRAFVNGAVVASTSASGTITQRFWEDVILGREPLNCPDTSFARYAQAGKYWNFELSSVARATSAYTPSFAPKTPDSNTLALANFDNTVASGFSDVSRAPIIRVKIGASGQGWIVERSSVDANYTQSVGLRNLLLQNDSGPALLMQNCPNAVIDEVAVIGKTYAAAFAGIKYSTQIKSLRATNGAGANGKIGVLFSGGPGSDVRVGRFDIEGFGINLMAFDGPVQVDKCFLNTSQYTLTAINWIGGAPSFGVLQVDKEQAVAAGYTRESLVTLSGIQACNMPGAQFNDANPENHPHVKIDYPRPYAGFSAPGARFTGVGGDAVISIPNGVGASGKLSVNLAGAVKLSDSLNATTKLWVTEADALQVATAGVLLVEATAYQARSLPSPITATATRSDAYVFGKRFRVNAALCLRGFCRKFLTGNGNREMGLWEGATLLRNATILASAASDADGFKSVAVSPYWLLPGHTYIVAGLCPAGENHLEYWNQPGVLNGLLRQTEFCYKASGTLVVPDIFGGSGMDFYDSAGFMFTLV